MADYSVPSFVLDKEIQVHLTIPPTEAILTDQGYTYNQAGLTYNQAGIQYGGVTNNNEDLMPVFAILSEIPHLEGIYDQYTPISSPPPPPSSPSNSGLLIGILGLT